MPPIRDEAVKEKRILILFKEGFFRAIIDAKTSQSAYEIAEEAIIRGAALGFRKYEAV